MLSKSAARLSNLSVDATSSVKKRENVAVLILRYYTLAFFIVRCEFREMGTPEARNLTSVRCGFIFYLFLQGGEK